MSPEHLSLLAQARIERDLTQAEIAECLDVDVSTVCRWERSSSRPHRRHLKKLCDLFGKTAADLGFPAAQTQATKPHPALRPSGSLEGSRLKEEPVFAPYFEHHMGLRLWCLMHDWQFHRKPFDSYAVLQHRLNRELEKDTTMTTEPEPTHKGVDMGRRSALHQLALAPIHVLSLGALGTTPIWVPEDLLTHCAAGITACDHLSKGIGEDLRLAYAALSTYVPPLKQVVDQSSVHRKEAARLVAQALRTKATLSVHKEGSKRAISYGKQAVIYSKESGDIPLQAAILRRLAWIYACDKQEKQALETILQAQSLLQEYQKRGVPIHPMMQSILYGAVAKYQARNGLDEDALVAMGNAKNAFFTSRDDDASFVVDLNYSVLLLHNGLTYYHLEQYEQALETFAQAIDPETLTSKVPASSERVRIEIINNETLASLKRPTKDLELSLHLWTAGIQGAIALQSEQRLSEALTAYDIMQALWPGERRIKELRDVTRHW